MAFTWTCTVILLVCSIILFKGESGLMLPPLIRLAPFLSLAVLWSYSLVFQMHGRPGFWGVVVLIVFYFLSIVMVFPVTLGVILLSFLDREKDIPPLVQGAENSTKDILVVYHPGRSSLTTETLKRIAALLNERGYAVTIHAANRRLKLDLHDISALGFASPIYGGDIRPPLKSFIARTDLTGITCFTVITGGGDQCADTEIAKVIKYIEDRGGKTAAAGKFSASAGGEEQKNKARSFADTLLAQLSSS